MSRAELLGSETGRWTDGTDCQSTPLNHHARSADHAGSQRDPDHHHAPSAECRSPNAIPIPTSIGYQRAHLTPSGPQPIGTYVRFRTGALVKGCLWRVQGGCCTRRDCWGCATSLRRGTNGETLKRVTLFAASTLITLVAVGSVATVAAFSSDENEGGAGVRSGTDEANDVIKVGIKSEGGLDLASAWVINHSATTSDYVVEVNATSPDGVTQYSSASVQVFNVKPGQWATGLAAFPIPVADRLPKDTIAVVGAVQRLDNWDLGVVNNAHEARDVTNVSLAKHRFEAAATVTNSSSHTSDYDIEVSIESKDGTKQFAYGQFGIDDVKPGHTIRSLTLLGKQVPNGSLVVLFAVDRSTSH